MCRAHRYPPTTPEMANKSRGIGAHTDFGALTLLMQDDSEYYSISDVSSVTNVLQVGGLEVFHKPSETWHQVTPIKDAFVVNIGDMMGKASTPRFP